MREHDMRLDEDLKAVSARHAETSREPICSLVQSWSQGLPKVVDRAFDLAYRIEITNGTKREFPISNIRAVTSKLHSRPRWTALVNRTLQFNAAAKSP